jgi:signal transduction histidine kinase
LRLPLPQTLFGRLFAAIIGAVAVTLLIIVLLIVRERREFALFDSSSGASAESIAELSQYLASLPQSQRAGAREQLRAQPPGMQDAHPPHRRPPRHENPRQLERAFSARLQKELGNRYSVSTGPPRSPSSEVIALVPERNPSHAPPARDRPPGPPRLFDVTVTLPDGEPVVFRTRAPRPGPHLAHHIFIQLGIVTIALSLLLYAMTRTITKPLAELASAADAVGRGNSELRLEERGTRELRRATRAFNAMQDRLRRYLDSRTRVLAAMSHDLRTPLTRLRLRVESIEDEALRQRCAADLDEMASMIRGALAAFRGLNDEEPAVPVDVNALAHELQQQYAELGARLDIVGSANTACVGRPLALKRCLGNLVQNAIQHGTHASIVIESGEEPGEELIIRVRDDGPGIPPEQLEQVFEPFFRLESSRNRDTGGSGLGLSIARDIAQAHGGSLVLRNRAEGGLEAVLTLPLRP